MMGNSDFCHNCFAHITDEKCEKCGYVSVEANDNISLAPGTVLNKKYKLGRVVGRGGFGITYKAMDIATGNVVVVKEYVPMNGVYRDFSDNTINIKSSNYREMFTKGMNSFIQEANFLVLLKNNENIVEIYDCFNENGTAYYVMEFLDGYTFKEIGSANYTLAYESILKVASALDIIHKKGIVHRDISPQNIFLLKNSNIKIIDFGNARYYNKQNKNDDDLVLKPTYSPPELYMKQNVQGPWTDIYSLAATFYSMVTGTKIPNALDRIDGKPIIPIRKYVPNIDYGLEQAINHALEIDYVKRQKSIAEFLAEVNNPILSNNTMTVEVEESVKKIISSGNVYNPYSDNNAEHKPENISDRKERLKRFFAPKTPQDTRSSSAARNLQRSSAVNITPRVGTASRAGSITPRINTAPDEIIPRVNNMAKQPEPVPNSRPSVNRTVKINDSTTVKIKKDTYPATKRNNKSAYVVAYDNRQYPISDIRNIVIGRNASNSHIVIPDNGISRKHCVIEYSSVKNEFYIIDWSSNGTYLINGSRLKYGVRYILKSGDVFYIFKPEYKFKVVIT